MGASDPVLGIGNFLERETEEPVVTDTGSTIKFELHGHSQMIDGGTIHPMLLHTQDDCMEPTCAPSSSRSTGNRSPET